MRKLLLIILFTLAFFGVKAQTTLAAGDIAVVRMNQSGPDGFSIVTLVPLQAGTTMYITEQGWRGATLKWAANSESHFQFTTGTQAYSAGTVFHFDEESSDILNMRVNNSTSIVNTFSAPTFNYAGGDQVIVYQGTLANPIFITGFTNDNGGSLNTYGFGNDAVTKWTEEGDVGGDSRLDGAQTSRIPTGLTNGTNAISIYHTTSETEVPNHRYNGSLTGTKAELMAAINNRANWVAVASPIYPTTTFGGSFTVNASGVALSTNPTLTFSNNTGLNTKATDGIGGSTIITDLDLDFFAGDKGTGVYTASTTMRWENAAYYTSTNGFNGITPGPDPGMSSSGFSAFVIKSSSQAANFSLKSIKLVDWGSVGPVVIAGYNNGTQVGTVSVSLPTNGDGVVKTQADALTPAYFNDIDEIRIYSNSTNQNIWIGINDIQVGSPIATPAPTITGNPANRTVCNNSNTTFGVSATGTGLGYQWMENRGLGFSAVSNGGVYSGATGATLTLTGVTASMSGWTYRCVVTNGGGSVTSNMGTLTVSAINMSNGSFTTVSCNGGGNGTATVVPTGGIAPYTYSWAPSGGTNATATGLSVGVYTVTVTDNLGCTATRSFTITQPTALNVNAGSKTDVSCNGGGNGTATVSPTGGTPGYTYSWAPSGGTNATATGLSVGVYTVTVTDANGCTATKSFTITQPTALVATAGAQTNNTVYNGTAGSATVSVTGGTPGYSYSWAPSGGTAATASGLAAGTYTVTVTDANACQTTQSFTITQPAALVLSAQSQTNVSCNGGGNGTATVAVTTGTGPYTYSWAPSGGTAATATGLSAGTYTVTVTGAGGSSATQGFTITQPATALSAATGGGKTDVSCNGGGNGTATVSPTGGTPGYTYSWAPSGGTAATATGLSAGTYTVTVTDANGCQATRSFTINQPATALSAATGGGKTDVSCNGGSNGTATVAPTGGTPGYTYSWAPSGGTNATATGLSAGTYTVTITDANACTTTRSFTINQPATALSTTGSKTDVSCNGGGNGTATVVASGGTPGYTYSWAPSGGTAATATGLSVGVYTVTVTDANGCQATRSFTITQPTALNTTAGSKTDVSCNGGANGTATVAPTGGTPSYTYSWAPSGGTNATATGLAPGTYTVTVTDANGCQATRSFTINQPATALSAATGGGKTDVSCNGGSNGTATVSPTGGTPGYTYSWAPSGGTSATATGLAAGTYTVTVTDANGCQATRSFTINQPATVLSAATGGGKTDVSCNGGSNGTATVAPTGGTPGYTYSWAPTGGTAATATGLTAGTYTVTVTDANGCQATRSFTITQPTALVASPVAQTNIACNGGATGSATVSASGGTGPYTYSWAPTGGTAATATGLVAGTYTVTVTDANGCSKAQSFTLTQPTVLTASPVAQTNIACNGGTTGSATVAATGGTPGYTYSWAPSGGTAATATGLSAGTYTVTVTDANGCSKTQSFTITQPTALVATAGAQTNNTVYNGTTGSATVSVTGGTPGYTYSWSPSGGTAATATGLAAGTYTVTVTDANACSTTQSFTITQPPALTVSAQSQTNIACNGSATGSATVAILTGTGPYTYSWAPTGGTAATATGLTAGTYTVTVTGAGGSSATQSFTLTQPSALVATAGAQTNVSCNSGANGSATVAVTGGTGSYTYSWAPSGGTAATATGLAAGTYTVTVTDANACSTTQSFTITQPSALVATAGSQTNVSCNSGANGSATVAVTGGTPGYTYSWAPSGGTAATATGLSAGTYTVTVTDANGCSTTQSFTITQPSALVATAGSQTNVSCNGGSNGSATVAVTGGTGSYTYSWAPTGGTAATATGLSAGTYTVTVTDANGCSTAQSFTLTQPSALVATAVSQTNIACNGSATGSATVSASGGTGPYTYSWAPSGGTAATASGLSAGTYTVTVTDANGCSKAQSFTLTQPSALVATAGSQTNVSCNGGANGSATVAVTGGTGPYTYSWAPSGGTAATATGLSAGTYTVTVTDANACSTTRSFTITQPSALVATAGAQTNVSCFGGSNGSATVTVTGGTAPYTYSWSPTGGAAATASGLSAGTYTVTVTDANGCSTAQSFALTQPSAVVLATSSLSGGTVGVAYSQVLSASGASGSYSYSSGPLPAGLALSAGGTLSGTPTSAGSFSISVTATDNTCSSVSATATISIVVAKGSQSISFAAIPGRTYGDAPFALTATGGGSGNAVTYSSSNTAVATISGSTVTITGVGTTTITANQAGSADYNAAPAVPRTLTVGARLIKVIVDAKTKTYGDADPVLTYKFSPALSPGDVFTGSLARAAGENVGSYAITQGTLSLSGNYELGISEAKLSILPRTLSVRADNKTKTYGDTDPVLTYTVTGGLPSGSTVSGSLSRTAGEDVGSYAITQGSLEIGGGNYVLDLAGGSLSITRRALEIRADNKTRTAGTANPVLTVSYSGFKAGETSSVLSVQPTVSTTATLSSPVGSYDITASGAVAANYAITYLKGTLTVSAPVVNEAPTLDAIASQSVCASAAEQSIALSGITPGKETAQTVSLSVSSSNPGLFASLTVAKGSGSGGTLAYRPAAGASGTATVTVTVKDNGGTDNGGTDSYSRTFTITVNAVPVAAITASRTGTVDKGQEVVLTASGGTGYQWASAPGIVSGQGTAALVVRPTATTTYTVTVTGAGGCSSTASITVTVGEQVVQVKPTNIMSPNGDGVNDKWVVENLELYPQNEVKVFDKAGRVIYSKKGYDNSWDATLRGAPLGEGTYYYIIDYYGDGRTLKKGFITILNKN